MLELKSISFAFGSNQVFDGLSHQFKEGEITSVVGASGIGKSTLFALLSGREQPWAGRIFLNDTDLTPMPTNIRPVITMFQQESLFPHMNIYDNIRFPLVSKYNKTRFKGVKHKEYIAEKLREVNLSGFENRFPDTLSGGQKQRATLARSIAAKPKILLLDEPFSALNEDLKFKLNNELSEIVRANNIIALKITHDIFEALNFSDNILYLGNGLNYLFKTSELDTLKAPAAVVDYMNLGLLSFDKSCYFPLGKLNETSGNISFECEVITLIRRGGLIEYTLSHNEQTFKYFSKNEHKNTMNLFANDLDKVLTLSRS